MLGDQPFTNDSEEADRVPTLTSLSFAHPEVPSWERSGLALTDTRLGTALRKLEVSGRVPFFLDTCLRVEIAYPGDPGDVSAVLIALYGDDSMVSKAVVRHDDEAFLHLCRIVAGLESPLIGEPEVLAQFRSAAASYQEAASVPNPLSHTLESAVAVGRAARRRLGDRAEGSLGSAAARIAVDSGSVAVLGSGAMARAVVRGLGPAAGEVFARSPVVVEGRESLDWDGALQALERYPAVVSTVPGHTPLFRDDAVRDALSSRSDPLLLVDLAMPPGFEAHREQPGLTYRGIDDVASSVTVDRRSDLDDMVFAEASAAWARIGAGDRTRSVISSMVRHAEQAVDEEVQRFAGRIAAADDPEPALRQLAQTVARRVLHGPISYLGSAAGGNEAADVFAEAFGLDDG